NWHLLNWDGQGVSQTPTAYKGNYAIELKTFLGNNNGKPAAQRGAIGTGYYPQNCSGSCPLYGGYPFANQIDTLEFWYKYTPMNGDSAWVGINFKKNFGNFNSLSKYLTASSSFQKIDIPFNTSPQTADTVAIFFQSSNWTDSLVASVGSDLIIDEVHFKSQPLNTAVPFYYSDNRISIFPNPSEGVFTVYGLTSPSGISVYNLVGEKIIDKTIENKQEVISITNSDNGIYFIKIVADDQTVLTRKMIINKK
ncbi:MAG TPA: T9SS type A sorting domain-containing protein, partial [Bacteroidia bacterium]